jgi:TolB protein
MACATCLCRAADVRVSKAGSAKTVLNTAGFTVGRTAAADTFYKTLEADLKRSGWFTPSRSGGQLSMLGSCADQGGSLRVECSVYGTADRRRYLSNSYNQPAAQARRLAHRVADDIVEAVTKRKGIASTRIAMVGTRSGKKEVYLCDADGQNIIQLTNDGSVSVAPKWGPKARKLLYTSYLKRFPDVYLVDLASGNRRVVSKHPGLNTGGALAPDGRTMAVILSKDGNPELYTSRLDGGALTRLTQTSRAAEASPCWSPDGRRIVYVSDRSGRPQLYMLSRSGGEPTRLTSRGSENVAPSWGPNGLIAFSSRLGGRYQVCVLDPDSREVKQLPLDGADYEDPSWAPDGRHIVCTRTERYRPKVYILDTMGDPPVALTDYPGDWYSPAWSPQ